MNRLNLRSQDLGRSNLRRAFSLVELMIVIAIIVVLAGLVLAVGTIVVAKNEERVTKNILSMLDAAEKEWERQADRSITFQNLAEAGVWDVATDPKLDLLSGQPEGGLPEPYKSRLEAQRTVAALEVISREGTVRDVLAKLPPVGKEESFRRIRKALPNNTFQYFDLKEVIDGWGNPIYMVFPGRLWAGPLDGVQDLDGTIRSDQEKLVLGAGAKAQCRNRQVLFVSAGPDGILVDAPATTSVNEAADNVYSYGQEGQ